MLKPLQFICIFLCLLTMIFSGHLVSKQLDRLIVSPTFFLIPKACVSFGDGVTFQLREYCDTAAGFVMRQLTAFSGFHAIGLSVYSSDLGCVE